MKTRHFLTALALPALFAACTADEFESPNFNKEQGQRPMLSENFALKLEGDASTRYAVGGDASLSFTWQGGDQIGAAIIDNYDPDNATDPSRWKVIESLAGNYPFEYNASADEWKASTRLGIGHYMFVYPYNAADNTRGAMNYSVPMIQELYQSETGAVDLNAAIKKGNKSVYSALLTEDDATLTASLKNLFTYPKFVVYFDNGQKVTSVSKVVLEYTGTAFDVDNDTETGFLVKGGFDHPAVDELFAKAEKEDDVKAYWDNVTETSAFLRKYKEKDGYTSFEFNPYLVAKFPQGTTLKSEAGTNNKYIEVRFMMPAAGNSTSDGAYSEGLNMYIYTDNGIYKIKDVVSNIDFSKTTTTEQQARILARNASYTLKLKKDAIEKADDLYIVTNTEDWNGLVKSYGAAASFTVDNPLEISVVGDNFTLDASANMPSKAIFAINTDVKISGKVTMSNVVCEEGVTVTVEKGATLTTSGTFAAEEIVNKGTLNLAVVKDKEGDVVSYGLVEAITNEGTLNIPATSVAAFELTNEKTGVVENKGTMTISGDNEGIINNNGTMNTLAFTNKSREYKNDELVNDPTINNAEDAKILAKSGKLLNKATIVNAGTLTCKNLGGTIVNGAEADVLPAILDSKADAISYITDNVNGKVIVYSANTEFLTIAESKGIVEYTTATASESFKNSLVNTVIASKSYEVKDGSLASLTLNGTATLKLGKDVILTALTVNKGTTTLGTDVSANYLNVAKGAKVTIPANMTLTITGDAISNKGTILVGGKFIAAGISKTASGNGTVEDNGGAEVIWKENAADAEALAKAKKDYEAAMPTAIMTWISKVGSAANTVDNLAYDIINGKKTDETTASATFAAYVANNSNSFTALNSAFAAYKALNSKATLTEYYATAAAKIVADNEKASAFKTVVNGLTWDVVSDQGADRIYEDDAAGTDAKTATQKAIADFKAAVADGTITVSVMLDKVTICSSTTNYAPACSQVFVTDAIYTIFGVKGIGATGDWKINASLTKEYNKTEPSDWTLTEVKGWINEIATTKIEDNLFIEAAKDFVKANNLITVSKSWTYDNEIVKAIAEQQLN